MQAEERAILFGFRKLGFASDIERQRDIRYKNANLCRVAGKEGVCVVDVWIAILTEGGLESMRIMALEVDDGPNSGRAVSSIDGTGRDSSFRANGARRQKRRSCAGHGRLSAVSKVKFSAFFPAVLLLLVASFTSNVVVTAEEDRGHAANTRGGGDEYAGGSFERNLQEEHEPSGLFDNFDPTSGLNEAESEGGAVRQANGSDVDQAWLQFVANGPNDETQAAIIGGSCKNQLFIDLVYDIYPDDTRYELSSVGSNSTFLHKGTVSNEYAESYHAYDQIVCMEDGDYNFTIWGEFRGLFN